MSSRRRRTAGLAGAAVGVLGAGVAAGVVAERDLVGRQRRRPDPNAREPFGTLHTTGHPVTTDDGVELWAEVDGDPAAELTIVFVHGYGLSMDCWHYQRRDLKDAGRLVFYDQRSHGSSGRSRPEAETIEQLGEDLYAVLADTAPAGPVLLVGHSMGGMTIMALADRHPELFGDRVAGVALLSTAAGTMAETALGLPAFVGRWAGPLVPGAVHRLQRRAALIQRGVREGSDVSYLAVRRFALAPDASPALVELTERMVLRTPVAVLLEFVPTLLDHDKLAAIDVLRGVPTLVLAGERDQLTPPQRSRDIAAALPEAELVTLGGAGHMVILERPSLVNLHLRSLARRAVVVAGDEAASA